MNNKDNLEDLINAARGIIDPEMRSNCCDAPPLTPLPSDNIGLCSACKSFAEFKEYPDED